jgi:3D (Asp-Asp-Asp) domain-containing protein
VALRRATRIGVAAGLRLLREAVHGLLAAMSGTPASGRLWLLVALLAVAGSEAKIEAAGFREIEVTATAYNSLPGQTNAHPNRAAWGDRLVPGMKAIAVSRDLIAKGLKHGVEVEISGLPGVWIVRDKMAKRWRNKIDIFMGKDAEAAREWGKRKVTIRWRARP